MQISIDGRPQPAVRRLHLEQWAGTSTAEIEAAAHATSVSVVPVIATTARPVDEHVLPLLRAATVNLGTPDTVAALGAEQALLTVVDDPESAWTQLASRIEEHPQSAMVLTQVLRQTATLPPEVGLAAEAAAYSMLLTGTEFATWRDGHRRRPRSDLHERPPVSVQREGARLQITLDRPERRNALSFAMREALHDALEWAALDAEIEDVEIRGAGPSFCSGGDLAEFGTATDVVAAYVVRVARAPWRILHDLGPRARVHIQGAAVGAGLELAAFAHHVSATRDARLQLPEITMGLIPGAGGTVSVTRRIGRWRSAWLMLSGLPVDATTAHAWGLVDTVIDDPDDA